MHIGILGGSFNPAHNGHRDISIATLKAMSLDKIWWVITPTNPQKNHKNILPVQDRIKIAKKVKKHPKIKITCLESTHNINYSYLLINDLSRKHPQDKFYWIIGADNLLTFHSWYKWNYIAQNINIIVIPRNNMLLKSLHNQFAIKYKRFLLTNPSLIKHHPAPFWTIIKTKQNHISATKIRKNLHSLSN